MQLAQDVSSEVVSSVEEFDALLGVKADEIRGVDIWGENGDC